MASMISARALQIIVGSCVTGVRDALSGSKAMATSRAVPVGQRIPGFVEQKVPWPRERFAGSNQVPLRSSMVCMASCGPLERGEHFDGLGHVGHDSGEKRNLVALSGDWGILPFSVRPGARIARRFLGEVDATRDGAPRSQRSSISSLVCFSRLATTLAMASIAPWQTFRA